MSDIDEAGLADHIIGVLHDGGGAVYGGEPITQLQHALQTAALAEGAGAPIRLHVAAKRYLCAIDPDYAASLSPASQDSLLLQGGRMTADEVSAFTATPWAAEAAALRRWDDAAKTPGLNVPGLSQYRSRIVRLVEDR